MNFCILLDCVGDVDLCDVNTMMRFREVSG